MHIKKYFWLMIVIIGLYFLFFNSNFKSLREVMTPPVLPELETRKANGEWLPQYWPAQNWGNTHHHVSEDTQKYYYLSQGSMQMPVPYEWFLHLEQADASFWWFGLNSLLFRKNERFSANDYLLRFGFIRGQADQVYNPDGLPIGFSKTPSINLPGSHEQSNGLGFTCAACHTGHLVHGEGEHRYEYIIEGAPATVDLGLLTKALSAALAQTALSSKLPGPFGNRFERFARSVLGQEYTTDRKQSLGKNLIAMLEAQKVNKDVVAVTEGFTRIDALNRIGNRVFSQDQGRPENYHPITAPVNYPHIWTSSWFDWVQYDGSIMGPLIRNAGEALGVYAELNTSAPLNENRFDSSIPLNNLRWMEDFLAGPPPYSSQKFGGLLAPSWTDANIGPIDQAKAKQGQVLYQKYCASCHLPALDDPAIWDHFYTIEWRNEKNELEKAKQKTLKVKLIPHHQIGTDPAQGHILVNRTVNTAGNAEGPVAEHTPGMGINAPACTHNPNQVNAEPSQESTTEEGHLANDLVTAIITDSPKLSFALALGAVVQESIDVWFAKNLITDQGVKETYTDGRPNCLQAGQGYKARPLNGIWATAPFLHNGSVPTLKDLLCKDVGERPRYVELGRLEFDSEAIGLLQPIDFEKMAAKRLASGQEYTKDGYFILDTQVPGNLNSGHYFSSRYDSNKTEQATGIIGPKLSTTQCEAMLEYLKTL